MSVFRTYKLLYDTLLMLYNIIFPVIIIIIISDYI